MMKLMKYKREDRVKILEYKLIFEELIQVKKEYEEGSADLNYRLSFFREKLDNDSDSKVQKELYDAIFMGNTQQNNTDLAINKLDDHLETQSAHKVKDEIKPWAKKIYRK